MPCSAFFGEGRLLGTSSWPAKGVASQVRQPSTKAPSTYLSLSPVLPLHHCRARLVGGCGMTSQVFLLRGHVAPFLWWSTSTYVITHPPLSPPPPPGPPRCLAFVWPALLLGCPGVFVSPVKYIKTYDSSLSLRDIVDRFDPTILLNINYRLFTLHCYATSSRLYSFQQLLHTSNISKHGHRQLLTRTHSTYLQEPSCPFDDALQPNTTQTKTLLLLKQVITTITMPAQRPSPLPPCPGPPPSRPLPPLPKRH